MVVRAEKTGLEECCCMVLQHLFHWTPFKSMDGGLVTQSLQEFNEAGMGIIK